MPANWRNKLRKTNRQNIDVLKRALRQRKRELKGNKRYICDSLALRKGLDSFRQANPKQVDEFFAKFGFFPANKLESSRRFLAKIKDENLLKFFKKYLSFVARHGLVWVLGKKEGRREFLLPAGGKTFQGSIRRGHLYPPTRPAPGEPSIHLFETDDSEVSPLLKKEISHEAFNFFEIKDCDGSSILSLIEAIAYDPTIITFILHQAEKPYVYCIVGQEVAIETWQRAGKVLTKLRKLFGGGGNAGRPLNTSKFKRAAELLTQAGGSKKQKAYELIGEANKTLQGQQVYLSRVGRKLQN